MISNLGIFVAGFAWGMALTIILVLIVDAKLRNSRRRERERIETEKQLKFTDYGYNSKECEECHLPGDCPLCGAE